MKPWKILESTHIRPRIRIDKCELPNGKMLDATVMEFRTWANIVALTKDRKAVLVRQYRHGIRDTCIEFPGGIVEDGEDPLDGARRELLEETGYASQNVVEIGRIYPNPAMQVNQLVCYMAFDAEKVGAQDLDDGEDIEVDLIPLEEVIALAKDGKFPNALQLAILFRAMIYMKMIV
jgi:8-oxo-dGTP pyrophosphatase MutT (NUDIX family)